MAGPSIEQRVEQYVKLRDIIKKKEEEHKLAMQPMKDMLAMLNGILLDNLNKVSGGGEVNIKTPAGTVYKKTKHSASIADAAAFRRHVIGSQDFDLLDWKANITAVTAFIEENNSPPPGINYSTIVDVGVRRAGDKS